MRTIFGVVMALMVLASPAHAGLNGSAGIARYHFPDVATVYPQASTPPAFTVGAGEEALIDVEGVTDIHFDFSDAKLAVVFDTTLTSPTWSSAPFNGVFVSGPLFGGITSITIDPTSTFSGFDASRASIVGSTLQLNWNGLSYVNGTTLGLTFGFGTVPEPGTWALMIVGFGLIGIIARRHRHVIA